MNPFAPPQAKLKSLATIEPTFIRLNWLIYSVFTSILVLLMIAVGIGFSLDKAYKLWEWFAAPFILIPILFPTISHGIVTAYLISKFGLNSKFKTVVVIISISILIAILQTAWLIGIDNLFKAEHPISSNHLLTFLISWAVLISIYTIISITAFIRFKSDFGKPNPSFNPDAASTGSPLHLSS